MEDRHYLSEPRPIPGLALPTWEVDVLREGVGVPIMTLQINSHVLPPRQRKKKVVWKLPDTIDQAPKFGKEDKLRILELFKQQKKTLKREKRKSQPTDESEKNDVMDELNPSNGFPDSSSDDSSANYKATANGTSIPTEPLPILSSMPPGFESLSIDDKRHTTVAHHYLTKKKGTTRNSELNDHPLPAHQPPPPPPGLTSEVSTPLSPPGLAPLPPSTQSLPPGLPPISTTPYTNRPESVQALDQQTMQPSSAALPEFAPRYFRIPSQSPNPAAVDLAQVVTQAYYFMLTHGQVQELQAYYSPSATKSLTVGGAHAICASMQDIVLQLQSLVGTIVAIRGVLHQTVPNPSHLDSVLVVITGMCVRPHSLPFCHTLVLVPTLSEGYQIQNDALCFLTTEAVGSV